MSKINILSAASRYEAPTCESISTEMESVLCNQSFYGDQLPGGREDDWGIFD